MNIVSDPLTPAERAEFERNEDTIKKGLKSFIAVGLALRAIKEKRLYREAALTFDVYCQQKWGFRDKRAYQLIAGSQVAENLTLEGLEPPQNEKQARSLAVLSEADQKIVWHVIKDTAPDGKVTESHVKSCVNVFRGILATSAIDDGSGEQIHVNQIINAAITEETYERLMRQKQALVDSLRKKELRRCMTAKMELADILKIRVDITDEDALARVPYENIRYYVEQSNWRPDGHNMYFDFFEHRGPGRTRIYIPTNNKLPSAQYKKYKRECIVAISEAENRSQLGVYYDLMALVIPESIMELKVSVTA